MQCPSAMPLCNVSHVGYGIQACAMTPTPLTKPLPPAQPHWQLQPPQAVCPWSTCTNPSPAKLPRQSARLLSFDSWERARWVHCETSGPTSTAVLALSQLPQAAELLPDYSAGRKIAASTPWLELGPRVHSTAATEGMRPCKGVHAPHTPSGCRPAWRAQLLSTCCVNSSSCRLYSSGYFL